jgi:galactokinase
MLTADKPSAFARAAGRVNLMGDHTDYNDGLVLPSCIPQETSVRLRRGAGHDVTVLSMAQGGQRVFYECGREARCGNWIDYVQGTTWALAQAGYELTGFEAIIDSNVPMGAGLASSAALEIAMLRALRQAYGLPLSDLELARLAHAAETGFVGVPVGMMDQLAASLGERGKALFIDTRSLSTETVDLPTNLELVVIDSGVSHAHDGGDYRKRRAECEAAAKHLGVRSLRELSIDNLGELNGLEAVLSRRVRHVVTESDRVLQTVEALRERDLAALRTLFAASHASLRDDYQVSVPEIDALVSLAAEHSDIVGARLTGGGFGGSVVMLALAGKAERAAREIRNRCAERGYRQSQILLPQL